MPRNVSLSSNDVKYLWVVKHICIVCILVHRQGQMRWVISKSENLSVRKILRVVVLHTKRDKFSPVHVCYNNPMGYSGPVNQCLGWNSAKPESATIITGPRPTTIIYTLNAAAASIPERLEESLVKEQEPESGEMWTEAESQLLWGVLGKASRKKAETL